MVDVYLRDMRGGGKRKIHYLTKGANDPTHGDIEGEWSDAEDAWVYDKVLGPGKRPEHLKDAGEAEPTSAGEPEEYTKEQLAEAARQVALSEKAAAEDAWTCVSGKLLTSEREAFKAACKAQGVVPSKMIRAFVVSFCEPEGEKDASEAEDVHHCKECGAEIVDDYYRFGGEHTCGGCVTKLITEKEEKAYNSAAAGYDRILKDRETQPPPGSPESPPDEVPETQPPLPPEELERLQCGKCLAEAYIPRGKTAWTCAICSFLNAVGG